MLEVLNGEHVFHLSGRSSAGLGFPGIARQVTEAVDQDEVEENLEHDQEPVIHVNLHRCYAQQLQILKIRSRHLGRKRHI